MPVPSPCKLVCELDNRGRVCTACYRTIDEIARWGAMTDAERQAVLARLAKLPPRG